MLQSFKKSLMRDALALTLISSLTLILVCCGTTTGLSASSAPATVATTAAPTETGVCQMFKPIYWSKDDLVVKPDNQTMVQIREHNAVYKKLCLPAK